MRELDIIKDVKNAPARYVDTSGDTLNGELKFVNNVNPIKVVMSSTGGWARGLAYDNSVGARLGTIGIYGVGDTSNCAYMGVVDEAYTGNRSFKVTNENCYFNNQKIWNAGNDGSNSGLDADLLDGYHHDSFVKKTGDIMTGNLTIYSATPNLVIRNTNNNDSIITLDRGINANWRFRNSNGTLHFETDYTSSKGSYYVGAKLQYDTGHFTVKGDLFAQNGHKVYHTNNKPTLSELGAAASNHNHDNVYQPLEATKFLQHDSYVGVRTPSRKSNQYYEFWDTNTGWADIKCRQLYAGDGNYMVYHQGNKPTPNDIGALGKNEKAVSATNADAVNGRSFVWEFGSGNPTHIWGSSGSSTRMQVWAPSNITVGRASSADAVEWNNVRNKPSSLPPSSPHSFSVSGENNTGTNRSSDLNTVWKSGFYEISSGRNKPDGTDWHWVIHAGHTSNRSDYRYGMQIAAGNNTNNFYIRTTNQSGNGEWGKIYTTKNKPTPDEIGAMRDSGSYRTLYLSDWIRTKGQSGVYFQDFGGGWHMTDSTWIRSYENKSIYTGGTIKAGNMQIGENNVYHEGRPPSCAEIGAMKLKRIGSSATDYYILGDIYGSSTSFLRTTESGLLPYAPDVSYLGDAGNRFSHIYGVNSNFDYCTIKGKDGELRMFGEFGNSSDILFGWNNTPMCRIRVGKGNWYDIDSSRWLRIAVADENDKEDVLMSMNAEGGNWIVHSASMCGNSDNSRSLGSPNYRYSKVYSVSGVVTSSDENMKHHIKYIDKTPKKTRSKRNTINVMTINNEEDINDFIINTNDCYNFIKDTPFATYFYKQKVRHDASTIECEEADKNKTVLPPTSEDFMVGFIAQDIIKSKIGKMFLDSFDNTGYNYNLNNYVGIIAKALQEAMIKIEALESKLEKKER